MIRDRAPRVRCVSPQSLSGGPYTNRCALRRLLARVQLTGSLCNVNSMSEGNRNGTLLADHHSRGFPRCRCATRHTVTRLQRLDHHWQLNKPLECGRTFCSYNKRLEYTCPSRNKTCVRHFRSMAILTKQSAARLVEFDHRA